MSSKYDIVVIATNRETLADAARMLVISLIDADYDVRVYGSNWLDPELEVNLIGRSWAYGGEFEPRNIPDIYAGAKVLVALLPDGYKEHDPLEDIAQAYGMKYINNRMVHSSFDAIMKVDQLLKEWTEEEQNAERQ